MGCNLRVWGLCEALFWKNLNWKKLNLEWTWISYQETLRWREMHAWIWTHLLAEHSCEQECEPCGATSALWVHTKQWHAWIITLRKHSWHIQNLCKDCSKRDIYWKHLAEAITFVPWSSSTAIADAEVLHMKPFFSQPGLLLLPRLRGGITSAENGDNGMLYAKRQCRGRATMDGKWSQQPEITRVMGRTGSSLGSAVQLCWWERELLLGTGLFGFSCYFSMIWDVDTVWFCPYVCCQVLQPDVQLWDIKRGKGDLREVVPMLSNTAPPVPGVAKVAPGYGIFSLITLWEGSEFPNKCLVRSI